MTKPDSDVSSAKRMIIVGGCPRSGTTLVQNMLDSHPEVIGGPEFLHLIDIVELRNKLLDSVTRGWIDLFCSKTEVDEHIRGLIKSLLLPFAEKHSGQFLSEKSPQNVMVLPELVELFPEAKFVHIIRDPRAVIASLLVAGERARAKGEAPAPHAANVQAAIRYTLRCVRTGLAAQKDAPAKIHTIQYEKLVADPAAETKLLCQFLSIPWSPDMLKPGEKKHLGEAAITVNSNEIWYDAKSYYSNPNTANVERWKQDLAPYQRLLISRVFKRIPELRDCGYDFSDADLAPLSRFIGMPIAMFKRLQSGARRKILTLLED